MVENVFRSSAVNDSRGPHVQARRAFFTVFYGALVLAGLLSGSLLEEVSVDHLHPGAEAYPRWTVVAAAAIYVIVAALPFVPAAEIGLALMLMLGGEIALPVYACTIVALMLPYLVGRSVPAGACAAAFDSLGFRKSRDLILAMDGLAADARQELLLAHAPARAVPLLLRHRYVTLAMALNLPGNTVLGGGGGIALAAGMSRLYPMPAYLATVSVAVAPVPAFVALSALVP